MQLGKAYAFFQILLYKLAQHAIPSFTVKTGLAVLEEPGAVETSTHLNVPGWQIAQETGYDGADMFLKLGGRALQAGVLFQLWRLHEARKNALQKKERQKK